MFPPFFSIFPDFSLFFPISGKFLAVRGGTLPPLRPPWLRHCYNMTCTCLPHVINCNDTFCFPFSSSPYRILILKYLRNCIHVRNRQICLHQQNECLSDLRRSFGTPREHHPSSFWYWSSGNTDSGIYANFEDTLIKKHTEKRKAYYR